MRVTGFAAAPIVAVVTSAVTLTNKGVIGTTFGTAVKVQTEVADNGVK